MMIFLVFTNLGAFLFLFYKKRKAQTKEKETATFEELFYTLPKAVQDAYWKELEDKLTVAIFGATTVVETPDSHNKTP